MGELDPNLTGLGIGAVVLAFVFRTLWRQDAGWSEILAGARADAEQARSDAAAARSDAAAARHAETECRRRLLALEEDVQMLKSRLGER